jgi:predicted dithiol-disulfide oxidoreductase (DUF899 family)
VVLMTEHRIGTQEEWQKEREKLLEEEKQLTRRGDELAARRRQLLVYHFMFGPPYDAGCPGCSSIADTLDPQVVHLKARDTTLVLASRAPLERLLAFKERMGWGIEWASSAGSDFNRDLGFLRTEDELRPFLEGEMPPTVVQNARMCGTDPLGYVTEGPGLNAYVLSDGTIYRTYVTTAHGLESAMAYYGLLDQTAKGRAEGAPEPSWIRRHDEYDAAQSV